MKPVTIKTSEQNYYQLYPLELGGSIIVSVLLATVLLQGVRKMASLNGHNVKPLNLMDIAMTGSAFFVNLYCSFIIFQVCVNKKGIASDILREVKWHANMRKNNGEIDNLLEQISTKKDHLLEGTSNNEETFIGDLKDFFKTKTSDLSDLRIESMNDCLGAVDRVFNAKGPDKFIVWGDGN